MSLLAAFLALLIASVITLVEFVTTEHPRTFFFLFNCQFLYIYSLLYGAVAFVIILVLPPIRFNLSDPFIEAIIVGLTIKAFLNINLLSVPVPNSSDAFPIGPQTLTRIFEPWLKHEIEAHHLNRLRDFVRKRAAIYNNPEAVRKLILDNLLPSMTQEEKVFTGIVHDIDRLLRQADPEILLAMEYYLKLMGMESFNRIFPP